MNILLVGDDPVFMQQGRALLEAGGHTVAAAASGAEAWDRLALETFPVVIADWAMPGVDCPALCRRIREFGLPHYTYILLITASESHELRVEGLKAGADDFLVKPLNAGELETRLGIAQRLLAAQSEIKYRTALMEEHGTNDMLTGLKNERFFREWLTATFGLAARQGMSLSLILLMLHGAENEEALKRCARTLQENCRQCDLVSHCGHGEFAIILPAADVYTSHAAAARLQLKMQRQIWPQESLTTNFGVATVSLMTRTATELHEEARKALDASLKQGPDRLVHASQVMPDGLNENILP